MNDSRSVRVVLDGVPRVHFFEGGPRCPEDVGLPSALHAYAEYRGDPYVGCNNTRAFANPPDWHLGCSYGYAILTSGLAFQQVWHRHEWRYAGEIMRMAPDPTAVYRRALDASGYPYEIIGNAAALQAMGIRSDTLDACLDEDAMRQRIAASIRDHGRPVLALGVVGPPECGLVTGYDEGGDVLIGWSFFQNVPGFGPGHPDVSFEPSGYYRKRHWYADTPAVIILGERGERPPTRDALRAAIEWNIELARTPIIGDYYSGLAALGAWADAVRDDANWGVDWPTDRERYQMHHGMVCVVAEARWYTGVVLAQAGTLEEHMAEHLHRAAGCCAAIHRLMWAIWNVAGGIGEDDAKARQGTTPEARAQIATLIDRTRALDAEAIEHLERAASA